MERSDVRGGDRGLEYADDHSFRSTIRWPRSSHPRPGHLWEQFTDGRSERHPAAMDNYQNLGLTNIR